MLLAIPDCEQSVVLVYAGDSETDVPAKRLQRDQNLERFKKYTEATYKGAGKSICLQCARYEVEASLTGQLEVATVPEGAKRDQSGFPRDESGKIVGKAGFGHPTPLYRYRLVIESVSDVAARELPKPKVSSNGSEVFSTKQGTPREFKDCRSTVPFGLPGVLPGRFGGLLCGIGGRSKKRAAYGVGWRDDASPPNGNCRDTGGNRAGTS
jgi:hypothetical protein